MERFLIKKLKFYNIITEEESEIYAFGIECLVLKLIHCLSYFGIAVCLRMVPELIVIGGVLIPLRRSAGGYHAKTKAGCYMFSCFYIFVLLLLSKAAINQFVWWGVLFLADGILFFMSPLDNNNKKLDIKEIVYYRKKTRYLLIMSNIICILLTSFHFYWIENLLRLGICAAAFLLLLHICVGAYLNKKNE